MARSTVCVCVCSGEEDNAVNSWKIQLLPQPINTTKKPSIMYGSSPARKVLEYCHHHSVRFVKWIVKVDLSDRVNTTAWHYYILTIVCIVCCVGTLPSKEYRRYASQSNLGLNKSIRNGLPPSTHL